ncbi:hypothetical protein FNW02_26050 [Komarekiella sp. 'clone 1']|uniref:Uncharacterized protein n=1 Tax=Komarekiella delphini-convector SJRDD-AB1 TaxID=2593771 RepID=A0AA40T229_9NOST|nr:hypothetical protein [Komarekiella delphini-convector SJRDD-AB1]
MTYRHHCKSTRRYIALRLWYCEKTLLLNTSQQSTVNSQQLTVNSQQSTVNSQQLTVNSNLVIFSPILSQQ